MISGLLMIGLCCISFVVGHAFGWRSAYRFYGCESPTKPCPQPSPEPEILQDERLDGMQDFHLMQYQRGTYVVQFSLRLDELAPAERQVIGHTLNIYADSSAMLEMRFNVDEDDDVPF